MHTAVDAKALSSLMADSTKPFPRLISIGGFRDRKIAVQNPNDEPVARHEPVNCPFSQRASGSNSAGSIPLVESANAGASNGMPSLVSMALPHERQDQPGGHTG